jgi:thioester reductase-like protein
MSSVSVFSTLEPSVQEDDSIDGQSTPYTAEGYSKSKWVAEKLVTAARSRGLCVNIFRIGKE